NAKSVAGGEEGPVFAVPNHQGKLPPEPLQAVSTKILIQMQGNLTVRASSQPMPGLFELVLDRLVAVEFAVDNDLKLFVLIGDRLISGRKINDAQACVPETDPGVRSDPIALAIRTTMAETLCGLFEYAGSDRGMGREDSDDSTHVEGSSLWGACLGAILWPTGFSCNNWNFNDLEVLITSRGEFVSFLGCAASLPCEGTCNKFNHDNPQ